MTRGARDRTPPARPGLSAVLLAIAGGVLVVSGVVAVAPSSADRAGRGEEAAVPRLLVLPLTVRPAQAGVEADRPGVLVTDLEETPRCPNGMVDMLGYCIDRHPTRTFVNWYEAADHCQAQGKRLCTNTEWLQACDASPVNGVEDMPGQQSEWLSNWVFEPSDQVFDALDRGYFRCRTSSHPWPTYRPYQIKWFRCCASQ